MSDDLRLFDDQDDHGYPECVDPSCSNPGTLAVTLFGNTVAYACAETAPSLHGRLWVRPAKRSERAEAAVDSMSTEPARLHRGASRAQRESVESLDPETLSAARSRTLAWVAQEENGITCDALEAKTRVSHQSLSARLNWLERHGLVERDLDDLRKTRSGRSANPYHLTEAGADALAVLVRREVEA